jgi:prophage regulatory protein
MEQTSLKRTLIYDLMARGEFPHSRKLTANRVGWVEAEVNAWLAERAGLAGEAA